MPFGANQPHGTPFCSPFGLSLFSKKWPLTFWAASEWKGARMDIWPLAASSTQEPQPPFALETAEESFSSQDGVHDVGVTGMDQGPCALRSQPAMPVRKLLNEVRVEASPHRCRAMPPGVDEEPLQHAAEGAVPGRNLDNFAHPARVHVVEVPSDRLPGSVENGTRAQCSMARLAGRLLEQPSERARVVHRMQGVAVQNLGQMGQHHGRVQDV